MKTLAERIAALSPEQRRKLDRALDREAIDTSRLGVFPRFGGGPAPLSFGQRRLWFLDRVAPGGAGYAMPGALWLRGPLDADALERALREVVRRHQVLRTVFREQAGEPVAVVQPADGFALARAGVEQLPADERRAAAEVIAREQAGQPFDLERGPLFRATLVRAGSDEHLLCWAAHHAVTDGWSTGVLLREAGALYAAFARGGESPLAPLPIQYADFAAWQRDRLEGGAMARDAAWWKERLAGAPALLDLPTDHRRPAVQGDGGATVPVSIPAPAAEALRAVARQHGATLYMVVLAAFQLLLGRYARVDDVVVGSPVAGRNRPELEGLIGLFVDMLVVRTNLEGDPAFTTLLARVRESVLSAHAHQDLPFEKLVEELQPERSLGHNPVFQACFNFQKGGEEGGETDFGGLRARAVRPGAGAAKFDLTLSLGDTPAGVGGVLEYRTDLFTGHTAGRMARAMEALLEGIALDPERRISQLPLLDEAARESVLGAWSAGPQAPPAPATLHSLFAIQAARTPNAVALEHEGGTVTYAELHRRAGRVAAALRERGVAPETPVGVCAERSPELVAALLGVMRAGGVYVPLDPATPPERLAWIARDARLALVLAAGPAWDGVDAGLPAVRLDDGLAGEAMCPGEPTRSCASCALVNAAPCAGAAGPAAFLEHPAALAYVIYTSGSTGTPKGVGVPHGAAARHAVAVARAHALTAADAVLQFAAPSFDPSLEQMFSAWAAGARVVLRGAELWTAEELSRRIRAHGVTVANLPTRLFGVWAGWLAEHPAEAASLPLRLVMPGGEAFTAETLERWRRAGLPGIRLVNAYGPTEAVVTATMHHVGEDEVPGGAHVALGRPLAGRRGYVLDGSMRPVPPGARGELYLGGVLARGYLGRPSLTAAAFVPDPFSDRPGERLYRTGDVVRHLADGVLEFAGRADEQVKIRGFRVEPGEVEAALGRHPAAGSVAVVVRRERGEPLLAAWAEPAPGATLSADELRRFAGTALPAYMVPAIVEVLDALPRTPGGKVDRRALAVRPLPDAPAADSVAARTQTEEVLAGLWARVLGRPEVGVHDGFFALGGHSLSALQLLARVRDVLGVEVGVRALFEAPTVAGLAVAVEAARAGGTLAPPVVPVPRDRPLPLSFAQQRLWLLQQLDPGSGVYNLPVVMAVPADLPEAALAAALTGLVERHEVLRTVFAEGDGAGAQVILPASPVPVEARDVTALDEAERWPEARRFAAEWAAAPFDLGARPPFRAARVRLGGGDDLLVMGMHHAVADGWSVGVLRSELRALLAAAAAGTAPALAPLPVQYADYAVWQREWMTGEVLDAQVAYWTGRLAGAPPVTLLPTDRPRPAVQSFRGANRTLHLPPEVTAELRRMSREGGSTLFMTLLAAFKVLLHRWGAGDDVVVGTHVAGRERAEVERLVGFFVNSLVLRTDLSGAPTFRRAAGRVRETVLGAFAHQALPFDRVVEALQPQRDLSTTPLYQVSFDLARVDAVADGAPAGPVLLEGTPTTKFDLEVTVEERPDELYVHFGYATDLFDGETVERMLGHYATLLRHAAAAPDARVDELPMLSDAELGQLRDGFQGPRRPWYPVDRTIAHLFEAQAAATPERAAVVHGGRALTYAGLDRRAGLLARRLADAGVGPGRFVGVLDERGADFITGVVAVLKAGGACLPLDPAYPPERVKHMLRDSGIAHLVTRASIARAFADAIAETPALRHVVCIDDLDAWDAGRAGPLHGRAGDPRDPAYMLYTSGSTGLPKGAVVRNGGAVNHVFGQVEVLGLDAGLRFLQSAPASSDISVWQMLGPLVLGGRSVVVDADTVSDPARLLAVLRDEGITLAELVPAVLRALLAHVAMLPADQRDLPALRWMMATGEEVPVDLVNDWLAAYPATGLTNAYGPTEASDDVTQLLLREPLPADALSVSIGRPLPNIDCHVVDRALRPVPAGVPGELCVAGIAVGTGYHGNPRRTATAFVPNPFARVPGETMYRTGDLARWRPDGTLEFLGRIDRQVKVRGFRIELGDVEAALRGHPAVSDCAVAVRDGATGKQLAAWIVPHGAAPAAGEVRAWLRERLPGHMVPPAVAVLDALPLTPAGKVDRRALAAGEHGAAEPADEYVAPRTPTEEKVAAIWAEVLGTGPVGVESDFFALGGHSLLAAMVVTRIRGALGQIIPLRRVFEHTTVARLAAHLDEAGRAAAPARPALGRVERSGRRVHGPAGDGFFKSVR